MIYRTSLLVLLSFMMTSCLSAGDINLKLELGQSAVYSPDSSAIYFVAHSAAWKKGKTLWFIMPIEGQAKYVHDQLSLYIYQIGEQRVSPLFDLGRVPYALSSWKIVLVPSESGVSMTIAPLQGWDAESLRHGIPELEERLNTVFIIDTAGQLSFGDSHFPAGKIKKADLSYLYDIVRAQPLATFGLQLNKIDPASDKKYLKTLGSLENTAEYRRLVIEQVVSRKDEKTIRRIYEEMKKSLDKLSGQERAEMEWRTRYEFDLLERLMGD